MEYKFKKESERKCSTCGIETKMPYHDDPKFPHYSASDGIHLLWTCPMCHSTETEDTEKDKLIGKLVFYSFSKHTIDEIKQVYDVLGLRYD